MGSSTTDETNPRLGAKLPRGGISETEHINLSCA